MLSGFAPKHACDLLRVQALAASCTVPFDVQHAGDGAKREPAAPELASADHHALLGVHRYEPPAFVDGEAERRLAASVASLGSKVPHRARGPLADGFALPLAHAREHVQKQAAAGRARVDLLGDRKQSGACERSLDQLAEVAHAAGEPVQLGHENPIGRASREHSERTLQPGRARVLALAPASTTTSTSSKP